MHTVSIGLTTRKSTSSPNTNDRVHALCTSMDDLMNENSVQYAIMKPPNTKKSASSEKRAAAVHSTDKHLWTKEGKDRSFWNRASRRAFCSRMTPPTRDARRSFWNRYSSRWATSVVSTVMVGSLNAALRTSDSSTADSLQSFIQLAMRTSDLVSSCDHEGGFFTSKEERRKFASLSIPQYPTIRQ